MIRGKTIGDTTATLQNIRHKFLLSVKWPGKASIDIGYRTSALDVVPTLLPRVLGCKNPVSDYSVGKDLLNPVEETLLFMSVITQKMLL